MKIMRKLIFSIAAASLLIMSSCKENKQGTKEDERSQLEMESATDDIAGEEPKSNLNFTISETKGEDIPPEAVEKQINDMYKEVANNPEDLELKEEVEKKVLELINKYYKCETKCLNGFIHKCNSEGKLYKTGVKCDD